MQENKPTSHIIAGLIISGIIVIYSILLNFSGAAQNQTMGFLAYVILIGGLIFFVHQYGKANDYRLSFGQLFGYGFKASTIITLVMLTFIIIFFAAFPEFKEKILETAREGMEKQNKLTDEQIDKSMELVSKNFVIITGGGALFMYVFLGAIGSLLGAAITKKRPTTPFEQ
jgi:hypothetical protein